MGPLASGNDGVTDVTSEQLGGRGGSRDKGDAEECLEKLDYSLALSFCNHLSLPRLWLEIGSF